MTMSTGARHAQPDPRPPAVQVTRAEWRWVLAVTLALIALVELPALVAARRGAPDAVFSGFLFNVQDGNSYLAKMQAGAHGAWLFQDAYTTEPHAPVPLYLFYLLLGRLARALGLGLPLTYHLALWFAVPLMLAVTYRWLAQFLGAVRLRRLAWLLVAAGSGLSWLALPFTAAAWLRGEPLDVYAPEAFGSLILIYNLPHLALARTALLGGLLLLISALEGGQARRALLAGLAWLAAALLVPLEALIAGAVVGGYLVALALRRRMVPLGPAARAGLAGLCVLPFAGYVAWMLRADPVLAGWTAQQNIRSPAWYYYVVAFGLPAALALAAIPWALRREQRLWLLVWPAVVVVLILLPLNFQRRLLDGSQLALAVLAVAGLERVAASVARRAPRRRALLRAGLLGLLLPMNLLLLAGGLATALAAREPAYYPRGLVGTAGWLERNAPGAHVLSSYATGNGLPALAYVRVYVGHDPETPGLAVRLPGVTRFYQAGSSDAERRALLAAGTIHYVVFGPAERALAEAGAGGAGRAFDPTRAAYLRLVYGEGQWQLYRVISP